MAQKVGLDHRAWSWRAGRGLLHGDDVTGAAEAFATAISGESDWQKIVDTVARDRDGDINPAYYAGLAEALRRLGMLADATTLLNAASAREPLSTRWLNELAQIAEEAGDLALAASSLERLCDVDQFSDPRHGLRLARVYAQTGQWARAQQVIARNIEHHPGHARSYKVLADVVESINMWGGAFEATLPRRADGAFTFGTTVAPDPVTALTKAVDLNPTRTTWRAALAAAHADRGDLHVAISTYEKLLDEIETIDSHWALGRKQKWQFAFELARHRSGRSRVRDPLFECTLEPNATRATGTTPIAGLFNVRPADNGLVVNGLLGQSVTERIDLFVNGRLLRSLTPSTTFLPRLTLTIKRATVARFPSSGRFEARTGDGEPLTAPGGATHIEFSIPHGDGTLLDILDQGLTLEKKGEIKLSAEDASLRRDRDIKLYTEAREFFDNSLGHPLFLFYGTLLGCYRDGDFIPGDDDFDVGYVSDKTTPQAVKAEAQDIVIELVKAGFMVSFNRRGRLFRIHLDNHTGSDRHLDVHFLWFQNGKVLAHNQACFTASRDDFLPPVQDTLRGSPVWLPNRPEVFLSANYGPGWNKPDPGFRYYSSDVDPKVKRNLAKSLMTAGEYQELAKRVEHETAGIPNPGRLVSLGSQNLYPLDKFIS